MFCKAEQQKLDKWFSNPRPFLQMTICPGLPQSDVIIPESDIKQQVILLSCQSTSLSIQKLVPLYLMRLPENYGLQLMCPFPRWQHTGPDIQLFTTLLKWSGSYPKGVPTPTLKTTILILQTETIEHGEAATASEYIYNWSHIQGQKKTKASFWHLFTH